MQRRHEGRGRQIGTFLAGTNRSKQHPGHRTRTATCNRTTTTKGPAGAAAWATTGCNLLGPLTSTLTARRLPQPYVNHTTTGNRPLTDHT